MKRLVLAAALALLMAQPSPVAAKDEIKPLFADEDSPIQITISGPIRTLVRKAKSSTDPYPATLALDGASYPIELSARGFSRRTENCRFPPLRVTFTGKPGKQSLFKGQHKLKLVVHCRDDNRYEQLVLREYAAYRLYNILTPDSFRVRLAQVTYMDGDKQVAHRWAFFIEDVGDVAKRMGGKELQLSRVPSSSLIPEAAARTALFQYMIANADWAMLAGPEGKDCCHNSKLVGADARVAKDLTPVPYDFDYTGLVDAPYAAPSVAMGVSSVRKRRYWGLCGDNAEVLKLAPGFLAARPKMEAEIRSIPGLDERSRDDMIKYLGGFFEDIATPEKVQKNLLKDCRG